MASYLIGEQEARDQIDMFCDWYGIDLEDKTSMADEEGLIGYNMTLRALVKAFRRGRLEVKMQEARKGGETIVVLQRLAHPLPVSGDSPNIEEIVYKEITGATKANVKVAKNATETAAMWAALAVVAGLDSQIFHTLRGEDIGVAQLFGFLFLQI